ncbi:MAG: hypothetical protein JO086_15535 [Acidimicrobiia bacterium]|nr:hypothetical protein [Acidimicrobiia bacterium]
MNVLERAEQGVTRRRMVIGLCVAVAVALVAAIPGLLTSADNTKKVQTAASAQGASNAQPAEGVINAVPDGSVPTAPPLDPGSTATTRPPLVAGITFTRPSPTTTVAAKPAPKPAAKAPSGTTAPGTTPAPATPPGNSSGGFTPTSTCHNSYDPSCGAFSWQPAPDPNQPITGQVTPSNTTVHVGDKVTFTLTGTDPDASPLQECNVDFGDGQGYHCDPRPSIDPSYCPPQYGPWTPPAKQQGTLTDPPLDHTYAQPGTYDVVFNVRSAMQDCNNPYASQADLKTTVVVTP